MDVGAEILAQGGHAIDAVVAAAFMQMVVDPTRRFLPKW
jgi:gamma-glutamyltranspeptidase